ncbi:MFS transporter [Ectobacillus antri]|jgi:UMF1 family MFS transporter|uniref:MFS transporter n=2 Tax=Ectobacillus antri TaxID=2486280 RepID=A0ABT6H7Q4_9BACI|nr:MFS transporter [Ectobacillus antri]MDG4658015.1 MFS transporter [Ectobacillus antri]MDG5755095.1 MFS transporter [Ectobacillus antri]
MLVKLTKQEKSWMFYDWANSAYSLAITTTILPLYFKMVAEDAGMKASTSTAFWGYANSFATFLIALMAPVLGTIADYKGLKHRFFSFFFGLGVVFTAALALVPSDQWMWLLFIYTLTAIGFSGANVFYDAYLVDVTSEERMDKISANGFAIGYIGSTIPFLLSMALIFLSQNGTLPLSFAAACQLSFVITAIWWGLFTIPMLRNVKQIYYIEREPNVIQNSFKRLFDTFRNIKQHKVLFMFLLAYFFYIDGVSTIIKMASTYGADLGISATTLLVILLITQIVAFPFAWLYGRLAARFSGKTMLYVAIGVYTILCIYAYFVTTTLDFWILALLVGTSQGGIQALSRSYFAKLVPKEKSNEFFGFYNIFGRFAAVMGPLLTGVVTQLTGSTNAGVLSVVVLFIIGFVLLIRVPQTDQHTNSNSLPL